MPVMRICGHPYGIIAVAGPFQGNSDDGGQRQLLWVAVVEALKLKL